jgi:hypothetical protein
VLGWPKKRKLARAFLREYIYKGLKLAQLLGQLGGFLTCAPSAAARAACRLKGSAGMARVAL